MSWFKQFAQGTPSSDLIGAGEASAAEALAHYQYQHQAKMREAVEETFPVFKRLKGSEWKNLWRDFWESKPHSPRSLDYLGAEFLKFMERKNPKEAELVRFEWVLETLPWSTKRLPAGDLSALSADSKLELHAYMVEKFTTAVTESYESESWGSGAGETVLFWMKESGVRYSVMQNWELAVLTHLPQGVGMALEYAPDDEALVSEFFQWLGQSGLVKAVHN